MSEPPDLYLIDLQLRSTNAELVELMRGLRRVRLAPGGDRLLMVCRIGGFDHDPRALGEIPEVRAFCRRLVELGFISWLEPCVAIPQLARAAVKGVGMDLGLGAFEVWGIAEGVIGKAGSMGVPAYRVKRFFQSVLPGANRGADALLGE